MGLFDGILRWQEKSLWIFVWKTVWETLVEVNFQESQNSLRISFSKDQQKFINVNYYISQFKVVDCLR